MPEATGKSGQDSIDFHLCSYNQKGDFCTDPPCCFFSPKVNDVRHYVPIFRKGVLILLIIVIASFGHLECFQPPVLARL